MLSLWIIFGVRGKSLESAGIFFIIFFLGIPLLLINLGVLGHAVGGLSWIVQLGPIRVRK